ncbi:MAG: TDT family transporter [Actinomycetes bacterium]
MLSSSPTQSRSIDIGPNWFASVMGTGIIANAAVTLPVVGPSLHGFALVIWVVATLLLLVLIVASVVQWVRRPHLVRAHARDPMMAQFYGAPPMAMMTVGTGALLVGDSLIGADAAVTMAWVLWILGTAGGLITAAAVPFRLFTLYEVRPDAAFGGWLMPVVPPMVSATAGALLVPYVPEGSARETMLYGCYAMFGMSLVASLIIISMIWSRLAHYGSSGTARVPTLWIVLGPLGQSITAAGLLGTAAAIAVAPPIASAMNVFAILYGVPAWGFAILWSAIAGLITIRTIRRKLPFALTWWSFVFPVGTCVMGTTQLAKHTGLPAFGWAAVLAFAALLGAWITVAIRTLHGSLKSNLLNPPPPGGPIVSYKGSRRPKVG